MYIFFYIIMIYISKYITVVHLEVVDTSKKKNQ